MDRLQVYFFISMIYGRLQFSFVDFFIFSLCVHLSLSTRTLASLTLTLHMDACISPFALKLF